MNLTESLSAEMNRVRTLIPAYRKSSPFGLLAAAMMEADIAVAEKVIAQGDVVAMIEQHEGLKEWID